MLRAATDDERKLCLVVDVLGVRCGQDDRLAAAGEGVGELSEPHRSCRYLLGGFLGVIAAVETEADDFVGVGDRRAKRRVGERDVLLGVLGACGKLAQPVVVECFVQPADG